MNKRLLLDHLSKGELFKMLPEAIFGAEGNEGTDNGNNAPSDSTDSDDQGDDPEDSDEDGEEEDGDDDRDNEGLLRALKSERKLKKAAEKRLKQLEREKQEREEKDLTASQKAEKRAQEAEERAKKLAQGLVKRDLDAAIRKAAEELNFIDPQDAIDGVDRSAIEVEQDEDDPADIVIDHKAVTRLVKALASKKPHYLQQGTEDGEPTGSRFGGKQRQNVDPDEELRKKYPALNQR